MTEDKLYDLSMVREISRGSDEFVTKMVQLFIETTISAVNEMKGNLQKEEWDSIGSIAHKIKSSIDTMGIVSIKEDIRLLEKYGKERIQLNEIPELINKIDSTIEKVNSKLKEEVGL